MKTRVHFLAVLSGLLFTALPAAKAQDIVLVSPNGGETWFAGTSYSIEFYTGSAMTVTIDLSVNNGETYSPLTAEFTTNMGTSTFPWTPTEGLNSDQCLIRVSNNADPSQADVSASTFTISSETVIPSVAVITPNGGETFVTGELLAITWDSEGIANVDILVNVDGLNFETIATSVDASTGGYGWTIPMYSSDQPVCVLRVRDSANPNTYDDTNASFSIDAQAPASSITVTAPNGGEEYTSGEPMTITWDSEGMTNVDIAINTSGWSLDWIDFNVDASTGSYTWTPEYTTDQEFCIIRVRDSANPNTYDESDTGFAILGETPAAIGEEVLPELGIYPNPAVDRVQLTGPSGSGMLVITDNKGRMVHRYVGTFPSALDLSGIAPGSYTLTWTDGKRTVSTRLLKAA